jgi:hypothetical protein
MKLIPGSSVEDPDPYGLWFPGSGSFYHKAKIARKTLIPTVLSCHFFVTLKNDVNVPSKSR